MGISFGHFTPDTSAVATGMVAAYRLDEGAGAKTADSSGSRHTGVLVGATWTDRGRHGNALTFNGTSSRVNVAHAASLDLTTGMTLEAWVFPTSASAWQTVVIKERSGGLAYALYARDDASRPAVQVRIDGADITLAGTAALPMNTWSHLAATYDATTLRLYVNGKEVASRATKGILTTTTDPLRLGGSTTLAERFFSGQIDEVRIYNRALSATELQADMAAPIGVPDITPPIVTARTPPPGTTGVSPGATVTVTFSEALDPGSIRPDTFTLQVGSTPVPATVSYDPATFTATLTPSSPLAPSTMYTATVGGGTTGPRITDLSGNSQGSRLVWTFATRPVPVQGPGGPLLVVTSAANPFTSYVAEILRAEGLNAFATADIATLSAADLATYEVLLLGEMPLTAAQVSLFTTWVTGGGNLVALRPDKQLAGLLGLADAGSTLPNAYLRIDTERSPGAGLAPQTLQFHGPADQYTLAGATSVATLYATATIATPYPAVTFRSMGANGGHAAAFTYDLARSVVYTRQGNPAWAGQERDADATNVIKSNDLFFGNARFDRQPDWIDLAKVAIPQADEQQRLLVNLLLHLTAARTPLPRFWYFPRNLEAVVVLTGDDHGTGGTAARFAADLAQSPTGCSVAEWECVRSTSYVYPTTPLTDARVAAYTAQGFEISLHLNTNCANWTSATLAHFFNAQLAAFHAAYPSAPAPVTHRTHCIAWSDWAGMAEAERARGIRLDTNYYYWPGTWIQNRPGFFTGSGLPMRFAQPDGTLLDIYQVPTQLTDESNQTYPFTIETLLDNAVGPLGYYGVFTVNAHTDADGSNPLSGFIRNAVVSAALTRGIPVISAKQLLTWLDGRTGSTFGALRLSGSTLNFTISPAPGANGIQAMLPVAPSRTLTRLSRDGRPAAFVLGTVKGMQYAFFPALAGLYSATFSGDTPPPTVTAVLPPSSTRSVSGRTRSRPRDVHK